MVDAFCLQIPGSCGGPDAFQFHSRGINFYHHVSHLDYTFHGTDDHGLRLGEDTRAGWRGP